jgi:hypothetical protein
MFIKEVFLYFEPICANLASKFAKSGFKCSVDPQNYFFKSNNISKNPEFYADFKSVEKISKNLRTKSN